MLIAPDQLRHILVSGVVCGVVRRVVFGPAARGAIRLGLSDSLFLAEKVYSRPFQNAAASSAWLVIQHCELRAARSNASRKAIAPYGRPNTCACTVMSIQT